MALTDMLIGNVLLMGKTARFQLKCKRLHFKVHEIWSEFAVSFSDSPEINQHG